jgi:hypothetical protein
MSEEPIKWQPVMMVIRGVGRLECGCGAMAIFITATVSDGAKAEGTREFDTFEGWCQACFKNAQEE